jgi:hypothetical protein
LAGAIRSVEGVKIVTPPKQAAGPLAQSLTVVELGDKVSLSAVTAAVEGAKTPHSAQSPPGVATIIRAKLKPDTTPEAIADALRKANLVEE